MKLDEFNSLVSNTRLSKDSREAARLVLVEGKSQVDVAGIMEITAARVNQVVATVRREQEKKQVLSQSGVDVIGTSYAIAVKAARDQFGDDVVLNSPVEGKQAIGNVVVRTDFHLVQHVGKNDVVIHELAKIDRVPAIGRNVGIEYANGKGRVEDRSQEKERGGVAR